MKFHDGSDFTADDVVFSFKRIAAAGHDADLRNRMKDVVKVDDHTVDFILSGPCRSCYATSATSAS